MEQHPGLAVPGADLVVDERDGASAQELPAGAQEAQVEAGQENEETRQHGVQDKRD